MFLSMDESAKEQFMTGRFELVIQLELDLSRETDRGCALMAAEFCSAQLRELLGAVLINDTKALAKALDDATGPLHTFSSRIEFAYLMGLLSSTARRELHLIRSIRNAFAHEYRPISFEESRIANRCRELVGHNTWPVTDPRRNFVRNVMGLLAVLSAERCNAQHPPVAADVGYDISPEERKAILEGIGHISQAYAEKLAQVPGGLSEVAADELALLSMRAVRDFHRESQRQRKSGAPEPPLDGH
jgi:hypothetical protein